MSFDGIRRAALALVLVGVVGGCSDDPAPGAAQPALDAGMDTAGGDVQGDPGADPGADDVGADDVQGDTTDDNDATDAPDPSPNPDCDPLVPEACALPWPSNLYLVPNEGRETGFGLEFGATTFPATRSGSHTDPAIYRRLDGYSVTSPLLVFFEDLDGGALAGELTMERSMAEDAQVLWYKVNADDTLERVPYWAQLDPMEEDEAQRLLEVRASVVLEPATRYVVAMQGMKRRSGEPIEAGAAFALLRDGATADDPRLTPRQARFDDIFALLEGAGVPRDDLVLAWDFVTNSDEAVHRQMLHMRDAALEMVGEDGPELVVEEVEEYAAEEDGTGRPVDPDTHLRIEGTFTAPYFLVEQTGPSGTGSAFELGEDLLPSVNGTRAVPFWAHVPHTALTGEPHGLVLYGHGLLGEGTQVFGSFNREVSADHQMIFFACDFTGMSTHDLLAASSAASDTTYFVWLSDRLHQGMLEFVLLARAMSRRASGLAALTERGVNVDDSAVYYSGISQGGIFGATVVALSPDINRGHLGVPGSNYALMIQRSIDFAPFFLIAKSSYPARWDQHIQIAGVQNLWDQTDPVTYYRHISLDPFPNTPPAQVLLAPAKGDPQVPTLVNELVARSGLGLEIMEGYGKDLYDVEPTAYPHTGSGVVMYDFGNEWGPPLNVPPELDEDLGDPHSKGRRLDHHNAQMIHFFRTGEIMDVCGGDGCTPD